MRHLPTVSMLRSTSLSHIIIVHSLRVFRDRSCAEETYQAYKVMQYVSRNLIDTENTIHRTIVLLLGQRRRQWSNNRTTLVQRSLFTGESRVPCSVVSTCL